MISIKNTNVTSLGSKQAAVGVVNICKQNKNELMRKKKKKKIQPIT